MIVTGPFTEYKFYNDTVTLHYYHDPIHEYFKVNSDGSLVRQDGVTNVCHIIDKSSALMPWTAKMMFEKIMRNLPTQAADDGTLMLEPMTLEEFQLIASDAKSAHKDKVEEAANIGHIAHEWLERYIKIRIGLDKEEFIEYPPNDKSTSCVKAALDWMTKHNVRWISTEKKICSREHNYAGTMDGSAWTDSCDDRKCCPTEFKNHRSLIDWKSSNYLYIEYVYQTAAYQHAEEEENDYKYDDRWIIRLGKTDGKFDPWHLLPEDYEADWNGFKLCLDLSRVHTKAEERMKTRKAFIKDEYRRENAVAKIEAAATKKAEREAKKAEKEAIKAKKLIDKATKKL
jgi:hypothetical protein